MRGRPYIQQLLRAGSVEQYGVD